MGRLPRGDFYFITDPCNGNQFADAEEDARNFSYFKPNKYDASSCLGGRFFVRVAEITDGGQREMFSTEFWLYPDVPFGSTLWINTP